MFSIFKRGSKDKAAGTRGGRSSARGTEREEPRPAGRSTTLNGRPSTAAATSGRFATTENAVPDRELARSLALETAAKIDAIESEMARDFLKPRDPNSGADPAAGAISGGTAVVTAPAPAPSPQAQATKPASRSSLRMPHHEDDPSDASSDMLLGSAHAIELTTSDGASVIDEAAILFANRQDDAAEAVLRASIEADQLGTSTETAWMMLFELVQQRGDQAGFEKLTLQFALRFENSAPAWHEYAAPASPAPVRQITPIVRLPETLDSNIVRPLEQLRALAMTHSALTVDVSGTRAIDLVGAELLLRVINAFKRSTHELTLVGAEQLLTPLRATIEPGRRDATDAGWMLLLEVERLLGRQSDFEETGIQYCITYEVSPPSWEVAPGNLKVAAPASVAGAPVAAGSALAGSNALPNDPLDWRGEITGEGEPLFGRMNAAARGQTRLTIECLHLQRMAFSAASALLGQVMRLQQGGVSVEFRNVNYLVGALMQLLGVGAVATIRLRRS